MIESGKSLSLFLVLLFFSFFRKTAKNFLFFVV